MENIIICTKSLETYRAFVCYSETMQADFTPNNFCQKRPTVVTRGLHYSTRTEEALKCYGYEEVMIINVLSRRSVETDETNRQQVVRNPLRLFFVEITPETLNEKNIRPEELIIELH